MALTEALDDVRLLAYDTAPLIYFVEQHSDYFPLMLSVMQLIDRGDVRGVCSSLVISEVLVYPLRTGNNDLAQKYETVISNSRHFQIAAFETSIARRTAELRARYGLRLADAAHLATALELGCQAFLTNDTAFARIPEIRIILLNEHT